MYSNFIWKSCRLWDHVEKYGKVRQATDDNMTKNYEDTYQIGYIQKMNNSRMSKKMRNYWPNEEDDFEDLWRHY